MDSPYLPKKPLNAVWWIKFLALSFIVGAIAGTTGDYVHVITRTDGYPLSGPFPFLPFLSVKMPVWVPFLFGTAVMVMATTHKLVSAFYTPRLASSPVVSSSAPFLFVVLYAATGFFHAGTGGGEDIWLAIVTILLWWYMDRTVMGASLAILNAIGGTLFEIMLVGIGAFFYYPEHANMLGVPSWLPWLYMAASVCVSLFVRLI